ncbi:hypothetical protein O6H91_06G097100 [Diphasiastrum complanatum]|uniref:Uncharacterized protein n=1 Tax=Diphasiastrum complanatum TaxID=34168 RepID=A0ACC2DGJ1_DIPCM|nr:hypothetical protein O6H91_06G097100 [Diphasiastrum complanatum]
MWRIDARLLAKEMSLTVVLQVYVGRDQRRYVISDRYLKHPVFRSLMQKSGVSLDEKGQHKISM